jgi:cell division protein FtsW
VSDRTTKAHPSAAAGNSLRNRVNSAAVATGAALVTVRPRTLLGGHPLRTYHVILGATVLLLVLGLAMVLSASSIVSQQTFGSPYVLFQRQLLFAFIGVVAMVVASRLPVAFYRRMANPAMLVALVLLVLVLVIGHSVAGQRNWINIAGPFKIEPSEIAKLALVLWIADIITRKRALVDQWKHLLIPVIPVSLLVIVLILREGDFGNAIVMVPMVGGALVVAGAPKRLFALGALIVVGGTAVISTAHTYRLDRFKNWLNPEADPSLGGWQLLQGKSALGDGGWFGVGLGASRAKWGWLPEAHTDFIYAVVGEELGVIGSLFVIGLFATIAIAGLRLALHAEDRFVRIASVTVVAWLLAQTFINLGAVLQLLPITGVPLPLVSYGGSSLIPTLVALGMLMSFARAEGRAKKSVVDVRRRSPEVAAASARSAR